MTPKVPKQQYIPPAPTRADASVITAGQREQTPTGYSTITNNLTGALQRKTSTGKTLTTGGTTQ